LKSPEALSLRATFACELAEAAPLAVEERTCESSIDFGDVVDDIDDSVTCAAAPAIQTLSGSVFVIFFIFYLLL
jgi:hypothetical protein